MKKTQAIRSIKRLNKGVRLAIRRATYRQKPRMLSDGMQDVVDIMSYSALEEQKDYLLLNGKYLRTMMVVGYPYVAGVNWLHNLINFAADIDIAYHIERLEPAHALARLTRKITELETTRRSLVNQGKLVGAEVTGPLESASSLRDKLVRGEERMWQLSVYMTIGAASGEELEKVTRMLESELGAAMFVSKKAVLRQLDGLQSVLPRGENVLGQRRNMDTSTLAMTLPFVSAEMVQEDGILYGINKTNNSLVILDRFGLNNANSITFAQSGAGKSYATKVEILRQLMLGCEVIVIDPEGEYKRLCELVGGSLVELSGRAKQHINPLAMGEGVSLAQHLEEVTELVELLCEASTPSERATVERVLVAMYKKRTDRAPLIRDLHKKLVEMGETSLAMRLAKYVDGALSEVFAGQTTVQLNNKLVVFDISAMGEKIRPVMMAILANFVNATIRKNLKRRMLVIDEGWLLLQYPQTARYFAGLVRRARKYYLGVNIISQQANDFLKDDYGQVIASQASMRILLRQDTTSIAGIVKHFGLSETEKDYLLTAGQGEALILADGNHALVKIVASEAEHPLITTDPRERV